jgi:hypothetical protein
LFGHLKLPLAEKDSYRLQYAYIKKRDVTPVNHKVTSKPDFFDMACHGPAGA